MLCRTGRHRAMLDFGLALARQQPTFTFPFASENICHG